MYRLLLERVVALSLGAGLERRKVIFLSKFCLITSIVLVSSSLAASDFDLFLKTDGVDGQFIVKEYVPQSANQVDRALEFGAYNFQGDNRNRHSNDFVFC